MRVVALIVLIFGVALAGGAVFFASEKYQETEAALMRLAQEAKPEEALAPAMETVAVAVAVKPLKYGQVLNSELIKFVDFPKESVPKNSFSTEEQLFGDKSANRVVLRAVEVNEPILASKITGFGERATISGQLTPGMRAFTIRINTVSGVAGLLLPNDHVDIFLTRKETDGLSTNLIEQNVKIIAVDQFSGQDATRARVARTATVEVTPEQAARLALAQNVGSISLSLRQFNEVNESQPTDTVRIEDILPYLAEEEEAEPVIEAAPPPKKQICVRKGTQKICN
ncbi:MAG: Flp pilus assembly protein CpaB [Pikeienuella sp.]